jgi:hypothetical protein
MMMRGAYKRSFQAVGRYILFLALCWCSLSWTTVTRAQTTRIMVVSSPDAPSEVTDAAKSALSSLGTFVDPGAYIATARAQRLDPASEAAIKKIGLKVNARLLVAIESERNKCLVTFYDGSSGDVVGEQKVPVRGKRGKPAPHALRALHAVAKRAVNAVGGPNTGAGGSSSSASSSSFGSTSQPVTATHPTPSPAQPPRRFTPPPAAAVEPQADAPQEPDESAEQGDKPAEASGDDGESFVALLSVAGGVGERANDEPTHDGLRNLDTGFAPSLEIGLGTEGVVGGHFVLSAALAYRTVLGAKISSLLADGTSVNASIASHSIVVGVAPGYGFEGPGSADLRLFVGFAYRTLSPSDGALPGSTITGPVLRPELRVPIADGALVLRLAPEVIFALAPKAELAHYVTALSSFGVGIGGEANLDVRISKSFYIGAEFRESRVNVSTAWGQSSFELERLIALKLSLVL